MEAIIGLVISLWQCNVNGLGFIYVPVYIYEAVTNTMMISFIANSSLEIGTGHLELVE